MSYGGWSMNPFNNNFNNPEDPGYKYNNTMLGAMNGGKRCRFNHFYD